MASERKTSIRYWGDNLEYKQCLLTVDMSGEYGLQRCKFRCSDRMSRKLFYDLLDHIGPKLEPSERRKINVDEDVVSRLKMSR